MAGGENDDFLLDGTPILRTDPSACVFFKCQLLLVIVEIEADRMTGLFWPPEIICVQINLDIQCTIFEG